MEKLGIPLLALGAMLSGGACAHYTYAKDVSFIAYDEDTTRGTVVGQIRGADCTWYLFGYPLSGQPTLDKAITNARQARGETLTDAVDKTVGGGSGGGAAGTGVIRYLNNVSTEHDGFNAYFVGKSCLIVKGMGYK